MRLLAGKRQEASCKMIVHVPFTTWLRLNTQKCKYSSCYTPTFNEIYSVQTESGYIYYIE